MWRPKNLIFLFSILLFSCSEGTNTEKNIGTTLPVDSIPHVCITADSISQQKGLTFSNLQIDTNYADNNTHGLTFSLGASVSANLIAEIKKTGYDGLFFDLECRGTSGTAFACKRITPKKERVHTNKEFLFSQPGSRRLSFQIPFRSLRLQEGEQEIYLTVQAFPVQFVPDSTYSEYKKIKQVKATSISFYRIKCIVKAPSLIKVTICINEFIIDSEKVRADKFDFSVGGKGYPDPFWEIVCGDEVVYYSKEIKNSMEYKLRSCSNSFYCAKNDVIKINFLDFDNGPFNTQNDLIDTWSAKASDLPTQTQTISFGNISKLVISSVIKDETSITLDKKHRNK